MGVNQAGGRDSPRMEKTALPIREWSMGIGCQKDAIGGFRRACHMDWKEAIGVSETGSKWIHGCILTTGNHFDFAQLKENPQIPLNY